MYKTVTRILISLIAIFLVAGLVAPAFAAGEFGVGADTGGVQIIGDGKPDSTLFASTGKYLFRIDFEGTNLKLLMKKPIADNPSQGSPIFKLVDHESYGENILKVGNLTFKTPQGKNGWAAGDTFYISIIGGEGKGILPPVIDRSVLKDSGGNVISRITKNRTINASFDVIDPNSTHVAVDDGSVRILYESAAFTRPGDATLTAKIAAGSTSGKATFRVDLNGIKYTGKGNTIKFTVLYTAGGIDCTATVVYEVSECVEYKETLDPNDPDNDKVIDPLTPYIIVESYTYGGNSVTAGNEFKLRLTLRNTSETHTLQNIKMSVSPKGVFSMTSSSNTFYIDSLFAGSTIEKEITLYSGLTSVTDAKDSNSVGIDFDFQYVANEVRKSGTSNENITIPVMFPDRFEYTEPSMPEMAFVGEEFPVYIPFVNKGRSTIYNLSAEIIGVVSEQGQKQYLGNINAGSENSIEYYVKAREAGELTGTVRISYEDANMNLKELEIPFRLNVEEAFVPEFPGGELPPEGEIPAGGQVDNSNSGKKTVIGISFIVIAAMSAYVSVQKTKLKRSEFDDEAI